MWVKKKKLSYPAREHRILVHPILSAFIGTDKFLGVAYDRKTMQSGISLRNTVTNLFNLTKTSVGEDCRPMSFPSN
jgi:hypothetical protein